MLVVLRSFGVTAAARRAEKNIQSKEGKREKSLVDPTDHDTGIFLPVLDIAVVPQRRAHVPGQQTPAHKPDQGKESINRNVEIGSEADAAVQDYGHGQGCDRKERSRHEL